MFVFFSIVVRSRQDGNDDSHDITVRVYDEDYTLGDLLRLYLVQNPTITFCGCRPMRDFDDFIEIDITTDRNNSQTPTQAFDAAQSDALSDIELLERILLQKLK